MLARVFAFMFGFMFEFCTRPEFDGDDGEAIVEGEAVAIGAGDAVFEFAVT